MKKRQLLSQRKPLRIFPLTLKTMNGTLYMKPVIETSTIEHVIIKLYVK